MAPKIGAKAKAAAGGGLSSKSGEEQAASGIQYVEKSSRTLATPCSKMCCHTPMTLVSR